MYLGTSIKQQRLIKILSRKELAKALDVKRLLIYRWENNQKLSTLCHINNLSTYLNIGLEGLLINLKISLNKKQNL
ncbi:helix-turn-helix transcriptional regulator [Vagococcus sp. DIV0080]|uniref:Helix-turn-helix transcriptional regulator n=1 Tax=Candidatus Vagococcus giribetii TaxID=2230876 RepID=A0ABS3HTQ5_9ENTE|nr:helix-turn-helix transcriptional regulator [Vagococcus sp. DIV0080]